MADKVEWPVLDLSLLLSLAQYSLEPTSAEISIISKNTTLLPTQDLTPLTVAELCRRVDRVSRSVWDEERRGRLEKLLSQSYPRWDDEVVLEVWPVRSKADLSIRRSRIRDSYVAYKKAQLLPEFNTICRSLPGFDIITVVNFLNANFILSNPSFHWFLWWNELGAFDQGVEHYTTVAKLVDDLVKKTVPRGFDRMMVAQSSVLTGYRNPPYPGFDVVEETKALAQGGGGDFGLHAPIALSQFEELAAKELTNIPVEPVHWLSYQDYVQSAEWETAGSSSVGRVEWSCGNDSGKFKARKNLVADVVDLDALCRDSLETSKQVNIAITKSELGKLRMAVASDIYTYLKMSWITRLMGGCYLAWPGSTIEEKADEQTDRMVDMLQSLHDHWSLPFDYAGFDHQPTTAQLLAICRIICHLAEKNVTPDHKKEFDMIVGQVLDGFNNATLSVRDGQEEVQFRVEGGVMSGLRWTTILGNGWNTVMTAWVKQTLAIFGLDLKSVKRWIRGDDSVIVTNTYAQALAFRLGYAAVGAEGSDGKFGVLYEQTEFLRTWYSDKCAGYPARAIPGLSQRKPWTSAPWSDQSTMEQIYQSILVLKRRVCTARLDIWWSAAKQVWSQRNHTDSYWLSVPRELGGLGVEPWDGRRIPRTPWPFTSKPQFQITNQTGWRSKRIQEHYVKMLPITREESDELARLEIENKVLSDDIPAVNRLMRDRAVLPHDHVFSAVQCRWTIPTVKIIQSTARLLAAIPAERGSHSKALGLFPAGSYGRYRHLTQKWRDISAVLKVRHQRGLLRYFSGEIGFVHFIKRLQSRGLNMNQAVDWALGSLSIGVVVDVHPMLSSILHRAVTYVLETTFSCRKLLTHEFVQTLHTAKRILARSLSVSALSQVVYGW